MVTAEALKAHATTLGFDLCGIAPATALPELARLQEWLDRGYAGEMTYLARSAATRADIRRLLPSARSVIVTGTVYRTPDGATPPSPAIARYAWGEDYHLVLSERLEQFRAWLQTASETPFESFIFVDKHHVQERVFARYAGLGWLGKNTCLINPEIGSWLFLAGLAVSLDLPHDAPQPDQCGACTLCLDACPTGALVDPYLLDATRCISYLTIEKEGAIAEPARPGIGAHVFGCDVCQDVCPWNLAPLTTLDPAWQPRAGRDVAKAEEWWQLTDFELHQRIAGSAMTRTTMARLRRNLVVAIGNGGDAAQSEALNQPGRGQARAAFSAETPIVAEHVEWAKSRLVRETGAGEE